MDDLFSISTELIVCGTALVSFAGNAKPLLCTVGTRIETPRAPSECHKIRPSTFGYALVFILPTTVAKGWRAGCSSFGSVFFAIACDSLRRGQATTPLPSACYVQK